MRQYGIIGWVIAQLVLNDWSAQVKYTPTKDKPLVKDEDGLGASGQLICSSVPGMILYLAIHTPPEITYAVTCCARYIFYSRHSHALALKSIGLYLKCTSTKGLILIPSKDLWNICFYTYSDFTGIYIHEKTTDSSSINSTTGYFVTFETFPVLW